MHKCIPVRCQLVALALVLKQADKVGGEGVGGVAHQHLAPHFGVERVVIGKM